MNRHSDQTAVRLGGRFDISGGGFLNAYGMIDIELWKNDTAHVFEFGIRPFQLLGLRIPIGWRRRVSALGKRDMFMAGINRG